MVEGKLSCRGTCRDEVARERRLMAGSETTLNQRSVIYDTSAKVYHRSSVFSVAFGLMGIACGILLFISQAEIAGGILLCLGLVFLVHGIGMGRAAKKFKQLAAEGQSSTQIVTK